MKNESVVHVCLGDDRHYYFGSVAAIFDRFTPDELGVSLPTLWNYGLAPDRPYKPAKTVAEALQILQTMAEDEGKLDAELVRQFAASHCWEDGGQEATIVSLIE